MVGEVEFCHIKCTIKSQKREGWQKELGDGKQQKYYKISGGSCG